MRVELTYFWFVAKSPYPDGKDKFGLPEAIPLAKRWAETAKPLEGIEPSPKASEALAQNPLTEALLPPR